jgi:hypothetical protein
MKDGSMSGNSLEKESLNFFAEMSLVCDHSCYISLVIWPKPRFMMEYFLDLKAIQKRGVHLQDLAPILTIESCVKIDKADLNCKSDISTQSRLDPQMWTATISERPKLSKLSQTNLTSEISKQEATMTTINRARRATRDGRGLTPSLRERVSHGHNFGIQAFLLQGQSQCWSNIPKGKAEPYRCRDSHTGRRLKNSWCAKWLEAVCLAFPEGTYRDFTFGEST